MVKATLLSLFIALAATLTIQADDQWITFEGKDGLGQGKHIVFVSGDDEYRSEEALPLLAKIMAEHHGFKCTVLFAIDPSTGNITPSHQTNIPGLEALDNADLAVFLLRFRNLPDDRIRFGAVERPRGTVRSEDRDSDRDGFGTIPDRQRNLTVGCFSLGKDLAQLNPGINVTKRLTIDRFDNLSRFKSSRRSRG